MKICVPILAGLVLIAGCLAMSGCGAVLKPGDENNDKLMADSAGEFWENKSWTGVNPDHCRKIAIVEFNVEYLLADQMQLVNGNNAASPLGAGLAIAQLAGAGKTTYQYESGFQQALPADLYAVFETRLAHVGFSVVPKEKVLGSAAYKQFVGSTAVKSTGGADGSTVTEGQIYPAPGFIRQQAGFFGLNLFDTASNQATLIKVAQETGADTAAVVLIRVGIDEDGRPTVAAGSKVMLFSTLSENWGSSPKTYRFKNQQPLLAKKGLGYGESVLTSKGSALGKGDLMQVDSDKYKRTILAIFPVHAAMAAQKLK